MGLFSKKKKDKKISIPEVRLPCRSNPSSPARSPPSPTHSSDAKVLGERVSPRARDQTVRVEFEQLQVPTLPNYSETLSVHQFEIGEVVGLGSFSKVQKATRDGVTYAIKILDKAHIIKNGHSKLVKVEKAALQQMSHPFIISLEATFQDKLHLYFVLQFASGGELFAHIQDFGDKRLECTQFYVAEVIVALEYIHSLGIIHRDLKPENILLGADGHVLLTDFGSAKMAGCNHANTRASFVGTAAYVSPEVLLEHHPSHSSDLWALGCIVYQCLSQTLPFRATSDYIVFQKILAADFSFPDASEESSKFFSDDAKDLISKLLVLDPDQRLGAGPGGYNEMKTHPFFAGINWDQLGKTPPPVLPAAVNRP